jgi:PadR family transcriptional regulator, regulatory protein PadR
MREPTYFVRASLLDGPLHGYAIVQRTERLSAGRIKLATGTLYTALDRLTTEGHLELVREELVNGRGAAPTGWRQVLAPCRPKRRGWRSRLAW